MANALELTLPIAPTPLRSCTRPVPFLFKVSGAESPSDEEFVCCGRQTQREGHDDEGTGASYFNEQRRLATFPSTISVATGPVARRSLRRARSAPCDLAHPKPVPGSCVAPSTFRAALDCSPPHTEESFPLSPTSGSHLGDASSFLDAYLRSRRPSEGGSPESNWDDETPQRSRTATETPIAFQNTATIAATPVLAFPRVPPQLNRRSTMPTHAMENSFAPYQTTESLRCLFPTSQIFYAFDDDSHGFSSISPRQFRPPPPLLDIPAGHSPFASYSLDSPEDFSEDEAAPWAVCESDRSYSSLSGVPSTPSTASCLEPQTPPESPYKAPFDNPLEILLRRRSGTFILRSSTFRTSPSVGKELQLPLSLPSFPKPEHTERIDRPDSSTVCVPLRPPITPANSIGFSVKRRLSLMPTEEQPRPGTLQEWSALNLDADTERKSYSVHDIETKEVTRGRRRHRTATTTGVRVRREARPLPQLDAGGLSPRQRLVLSSFVAPKIGTFRSRAATFDPSLSPARAGQSEFAQKPYASAGYRSAPLKDQQWWKHDHASTHLLSRNDLEGDLSDRRPLPLSSLDAFGAGLFMSNNQRPDRS